MENKLDCDIVRDLLPTYVDGLTSDTTNKAIEAHLRECADCREALHIMKDGEEKKMAPAAEVDYLKKVRRRTKSTSLLIGILLMFLGMGMLSYRYFYIGSEASAADLAYHVAVDGNTVTLSGTLTSSGQGVSRVTASSSNGMVQFKVYTVPKTFFNSGDFSETYTTSYPMEQVRIDDMILWESGKEISRTTAQLYAASNPYIGDMPANSRVASILGISDQLGPFTNELQTGEEPYGWTLILETQVDVNEENAAREIMTADSYAMLSVIENLGYVTWKYKTDDGQQEYTVTTEDATAYAGRDIKQCGQSVADLQELMQSLSIKWAGVRETLQETGTFMLNMHNNSDAKIYGIMIDYYLDGKLIGSRVAGNADNSALKQGDEFGFDFMPEDFPEGTSAIGLSGFSFTLSVADKDGNEVVVCENIKVAAKYAWTFFYSLNGNFESGFTLNEG